MAEGVVEYLGVTDDVPEDQGGPALEVEDLFRLPLAEISEASSATLPAHFA